MWKHRLGPILVTELFVPNAEELITVLQDGLRQHFEEVTVELVNCPDLTEEPFKLTASGLCGDPILLKLGDMSCLFPRPYKNIYSVNSVLESIYGTHDNISIIGASVSPRQSTGQLGELIMNASLQRNHEGRMEIRNNQSYLAYQTKEAESSALELVQNDAHLKCYPYGNFFVSKGESGQVLKVQAKKRISNFSFLEQLQSILDATYSNDRSNQLVGLGGIFLMKNARAKYHVIPYSWDVPLNSTTDVNKWLNYFESDAPLVAMGTLISSSRKYTHICQNSVNKSYNVTTSHFNTLFNDEIGGHFHTDVGSYNTVEYLGYFNPASVLYHVDPQVKNEFQYL